MPAAADNSGSKAAVTALPCATCLSLRHVEFVFADNPRSVQKLHGAQAPIGQSRGNVDKRSKLD